MKLSKKRKQLIISVAMIILGVIVFGLHTKTGTAQQQPSEISDKTLSPYFVVISENPETDRLPLKETSVKTTITGVIADVEIKQVYVNSGKNTLEAIYTFPMSTKAAVYAMKMTVGDRIIHAEIEEKKKAREDYERAKSEGKRASLLEQSRPNVFTMNVANINAGDTITVELNYTEVLVPEKGQYSFIYPTVVGPRYSNKKKEDADPDDDFIHTPYTHSGEKPTYRFGYELTIHSGIPIQNVTCNTHKMNISNPDLKTSVVKLDASETNGGNRDVIVSYSLQGNRIESGIMLYEGENENFFLMMVQPPKRVLKEDIPPREYIFIVDVSGSMYGFPLNITKKLMRNLIVNLKPTDKFNVLLFSGASALMSESSIDATEANIERAVRYIDEQSGGGGTEVLGALRLAYAIPRPDTDISRTFVMVTDGYVAVEREAFKMIRKNGGETNFFCFGIGSGVNRYLIEGMAFAGNGEPMIVTHENEAEKQAEKFRNYINTPVLTRIKLNKGSLQAYDIEPIAIPDMLAERPIVIFGKYKGKANGKVTLTGKVGRKSYKQSFDLSECKPDKSYSALRYLWARERIYYLDYLIGEYKNDDDPIAQEITELGLKYNLMTNYTSFVAIDERVTEKNGKTVTVKQPIPMPKGVSDYAVVGNSSYTLSESAVRSTMKTKESIDLSEIAIEEDLEADLIRSEDESFQTVETMPEFPGGTDSLMRYIYTHLHYPPSALEKGIQGRVIISFMVNTDGSISDIEVVKGVEAALDAEAVRIIRSMPKWIPGKQNGKPVAMKHALPITFRLPQE